MHNLVSFISGIVFAIGLGISGMTQPQKVLGFLNIFGDWDPSLMFVMIGAIVVHGISYLTLNKDKKPKFAKEYSIPSNSKITKNLIVGSFLFGIGWGISGFCPGPGIVTLFSGYMDSIVFVISMVIGMLIYRMLYKSS